MSNFAHVSSRLGRVQPATRSIAEELYNAAQAAGHDIWFMWGMGSSTEHRTGRALDLMVRNRAAGDFVRNYIWRNRARLRLHHVIWWQRITSTVTRPGVVRVMRDRGNVTANHYDHVHVLFLPGVYQAPAQAPSAPSESSSVVRSIQRDLKVTVDGKWGPITDQRARRMRVAARSKSAWRLSSIGSFDISDVQRVIATKVDGIWGPNSQRALESWIKGFQSTIGVSSDGLWGPKTDGKFLSLRRRHLNNW